MSSEQIVFKAGALRPDVYAEPVTQWLRNLCAGQREQFTDFAPEEPKARSPPGKQDVTLRIYRAGELLPPRVLELGNPERYATVMSW
jgi:hypothetical protein